MKRKCMAALLAGMILMLGGCVNITINNSPADEVINEEVAGPENESTGQSQEQTPGQAQDQQKPGDTQQSTASNYLDVELDYIADNYYDEVSMMYGHYNTIRLNTTDYPALTAAVEKYNTTHVDASQSYLDELETWARDEYKEYGPDMFMGPYVAESDMYIRRADNQVLSVAESCFAYAGGAHGNTYYTSVNFDVQTGEEISLESVITDMDSLPAILAIEIQDKYKDLTFWSDDLSTLLQEYITPSDPQYAPFFTWTLDYQGVTFYFSDYELGAYADGRQEVMVTYSEYPYILNSKYFENVDDNYVVELLDNWNGSDMDLNGDGATDYVTVNKNYSVDTDMCESFSVTVNDNTFTHNLYYYDLDTYFVKAGDKNYLYVQHIAESDFQSVSVFEITERSVEYMGDFSNTVNHFTNSKNFKVSKRMDLLSTYFGVVDCTIGEDGLPVETGSVYSILGEVILTSTVVIPAELVDEKGNLSETTVEFPAGTDFQLIATDGATYVDVLASDGQRCRFFTTEDWPVTVNGMNAESSFEMLWYAG